MKSNMRRLVIDKLLTEKEYVSIEQFRQVLQMSEPTIKRELAYMRKKLNAPIVYSHLHHGYYYAKPTRPEKRKDTPAETLRRLQVRQWYSSEELYVLSSAFDGLEKLERDNATALGTALAPMRSRILGILTLGSADPQELQRRIHVIDSRIPFPEPQTFETVGAALSEKRRVHIRYCAPDEASVECDISPVRLICYRNRWYVDAYCHLTNTLKAFQIEHIEFAEVLSLLARRVSLDTVAMTLDANYGIFHDEKVLTARIRFSDAAARDVLREAWHPQQRLETLKGGFWMLSVPYIDPTEVVGEVLRWGARVEVVEPQTLREQVRKEAESIAVLYAERTNAGQ